MFSEACPRSSGFLVNRLRRLFGHEELKATSEGPSKAGIYPRGAGPPWVGIEDIEGHPAKKSHVPEYSAPARVGATKMPESRNANGP